MISFDKLKIVTSIKHIKRFEESKFHSDLLDRKIQYYKYKQNTPFYLFIMINYEYDELVIEFTSKISTLSFFELINENTISECLYSLAPFVEFEGHIEDILDEFKVMKCDVTKDIPYHDVKELKRYVISNLANHDKWICEKWGNGFVLKNLVTTNRYKKRIVVYDKGIEIDNKIKEYTPLLETIYDDGCIYNDFGGMIRMELNIGTIFQVKKLLDIPDNKLTSVLSSNANPILTVLNEVLKKSSVNSSIKFTHKERLQNLLLKDCDFDLRKVETVVRSDYSKNTQIAKIMKPYMELHQRLQNNKEPAFDLRKLIE